MLTLLSPLVNVGVMTGLEDGGDKTKPPRWSGAAQVLNLDGDSANWDAFVPLFFEPSPEQKGEGSRSNPGDGERHK